MIANPWTSFDPGLVPPLRSSGSRFSCFAIDGGRRSHCAAAEPLDPPASLGAGLAALVAQQICWALDRRRCARA